MLDSYLQILIPLFSFLINIAVQIVSFRSFARLGLLKSEYLGFIIGFITILISELYTFFNQAILLKDVTVIFITNLIIYSALGYCYFHFVNLGETARRIRILREIYDSAEGLSMEEIIKRYNAGEIFEKRIYRLINNRQLEHRGGRYFIHDPLMLTISRIIVCLKLIVLGKKSEFDYSKINNFKS